MYPNCFLAGKSLQLWHHYPALQTPWDFVGFGWMLCAVGVLLTSRTEATPLSSQHKYGTNTSEAETFTFTSSPEGSLARGSSARFVVIRLGGSKLWTRISGWWCRPRVSLLSFLSSRGTCFLSEDFGKTKRLRSVEVLQHNCELRKEAWDGFSTWLNSNDWFCGGPSRGPELWSGVAHLRDLELRWLCWGVVCSMGALGWSNKSIEYKME